MYRAVIRIPELDSEKGLRADGTQRIPEEYQRSAKRKEKMKAVGFSEPRKPNGQGIGLAESMSR